MPEGEEAALADLPDDLLLQHFREGDETSFEALFLRHYDGTGR